MQITIKCECGNEETRSLINLRDELDKYYKFDVIACVGSDATLYVKCNKCEAVIDID